MKQKEIMGIIEEYDEALAENEKEFDVVHTRIDDLKKLVKKNHNESIYYVTILSIIIIITHFILFYLLFLGL